MITFVHMSAVTWRKDFRVLNVNSGKWLLKKSLLVNGLDLEGEMSSH